MAAPRQSGRRPGPGFPSLDRPGAVFQQAQPMRREPYTPCKLYIDADRPIAVGQYLRTAGGSAYLIQGVKQHRTRPQRRNLECVRWPVAEIPADATVIELRWHPRSKRKLSARPRAPGR